ncbi:acid protease, partial [Saccharata proteae CBS 121410]
DGSLNGAALLRSLNHTMSKYKAPNMLPSYAAISEAKLQSRQSNLMLNDQVDQGEDELYYGDGTVGSSEPQKFTIDFDTGSADFFIPGPNCGTDQGCSGNGNRYNQMGMDQGNTTTIMYGSGEVMGENYFDTVSVAGLTADHTNVISLTQAQGFSTSDSNSLMGMGFSTIANSMQPTFFENLISQNKVKTDEFSFYLGRAASGTQGNSEMALGGRDTSKFSGTPVQVAVSTPGYWQVPIDAVDVKGKSAGASTKGQAAIDTGTTILLGPSVAVSNVFSKIPGAFPLPLSSGNAQMTLYAYPCGSNPMVSLVFAGKQFAINPLDFNLGSLTSDFVTTISSASTGDPLGGLMSPDGGLLGGLLGGSGSSSTSYCVAALAGFDISPTENLYVVGDTFLKNWYSIYNYNNANGGPSVSFAKAV